LALLRRALDPFEDFWTSLLRSLRTGGLTGVKLVMSDAHSGLNNVLAAVLTDAEPDLLAFAEFPQRHWRQIWSTNPLERVNKEIKRRTPLLLPSLHAQTDHDEQPHRNYRRGDDPPGTRRRLS